MKELILSASDNPAEFRNGSIFFVGTATIILRYAGFTILTDPNFLHQGDHAHLGHGMTSRRLTNPAIEIEDLPPLDLVVLSHMHGDHFDQIASEKLNKTLPIVTTHHATKALHKQGFTSLYGLDTWESISIHKGENNLKITSMPGRHGPIIIATALPEVMGSLLEFQEKGQTRFCLYITGDTLIIEQLKEIPKRYPHIDVGLFHLGGTRIFGILVTMDHKQGIEALQIINPDVAIPIHYNDYEVFRSPLEDFKDAVREAGLENKVRYLNHGDTYTFEVTVTH